MKLKSCLGAFAIAALLLACLSENRAQDKTTQDQKTLEKKARDLALLNIALKDAINVGAKIFNEQGDHAGCYRLYQGSLLSVKPFLSAELQTSIDTGIATAGKLSSYADKAFELRRVLDEIRTKTSPGGTEANKSTEPTKGKETAKGTEPTKGKETAKGTEPTKGKETAKGTEPTKGKETAKGTEPKNDKGAVAGKITYQGKPITGGYAVTLVAADGKRVSGTIQKDGAFQFKDAVAPGDYRVIVEPIPGAAPALELPMRYTSERTSGIVIRVQSGKQQVDLNLVK